MLQDRYVLDRELGHGGMATVYLARDLKLHRQVAVKMLRSDLGPSLGSDRFLREIGIASHLDHPNILPLHDSGEAEGRVYYVMPYVDGETLRDRLRREVQLPMEDAVAIVRAIAAALDYAHRAGVIHRDIKPENVLLARVPDGAPPHPLVADFGIARALDVAGGERLTETGLVLGTPVYMSPEQGAPGGRVDGRSDLYSLGCVAYELLAGSPPFTGPTAQAILARHAVDPVPPLHTVRANVPPGVEHAITRALAKVPADRFATAAEFAAALVAPGPPGRGWRRRLPSRLGLLVPLAALAVASAAGAFRLGTARGPHVVPSAASIAVLPFSSATNDSALRRLGTDLAVTVGASLDGVGGVRAADRLSVAGATAGKPALSLAEGAQVARRLGASSMLRGTLVALGETVRLDLGLYDTKELAPLAPGITVTGHRDSLGVLTDSVSLAVLRQVWRRGDRPSPSLSAVTTQSIPALRAFLEGERDLVAGDWEGAALAYRSAMAADSTLWLAYFGYALARSWVQAPVEPSVFEGLRRHRAALPERERLLVEAFLTNDRTRHKIDVYRGLTLRFPDYWPGWFLYADILFHGGPMAGYEWTEALDAFRQVVALNPGLVPAWEHIGDLTIGRDEAEAARAQARLIELGYPPPGHPGVDQFLRLENGVGQAEGVIPADLTALADTLARFNATSGNEDLVVGGPIGFLQGGFPEAQLDLNRRALALDDLRMPARAALLAGSAWSWATRGQWDSAMASMDQAAATYQEPLRYILFPVEDYAIAVAGAWLGAMNPTEADRRRVGAVAAIRRLPSKGGGLRGIVPETQGRVAWLDGLLGFARRDRRSIRAARDAAKQSGFFRADLLDRSLAAFDRALAGDRIGAGRELAALEEACLDDENCPSYLPHIAVQRLMAAEWLREDGQVEQARRLLVWQDSPMTGWPWTFGDAASGPTLLARARLEETQGHERAARYCYQQFLRRYDRPMPGQRQGVEEARTALAHLSDEP
jgi:tetratricopeptide (TPR) repeat protein/TolB-like protein